MCDYSLYHAKSRPAVKDEQLVTHNFGCGSVGFKSVNDGEQAGLATAVCVCPGTQLAIENIAVDRWFWYDKSKPEENQLTFEDEREVKETTAIFAKRDNLGSYHDALEFADGSFLPVSKLLSGGRVRVLQIPHTEQRDTVSFDEALRVAEKHPLAETV